MKYQPAPSKSLLFFRRFLRMAVFFLMITIVLGCIVVPVEHVFSQESPFRTPSDGIGWALSVAFALETHGLVPVTTPGMMIATLLRLLGYTVLGGTIGFVVMHLYLAETGFQQKTLKDQLERMEDDQKTLKSKLDFLIKSSSTQPQKPRRWGL